MHNLKQNQQGFSLVELAIAITVIGILIAGIVKGQQIIDSARVAATVSQIRTYQTAITAFDSTYNAYPGDLNNLALLDCVAAAGCTAGNADRRIAIGGRAGTTGTLGPSWSQAVSANDEPAQFWKHLAVAELISDVDLSADVSTVAGLASGVSHPTSRLGGNYDVFFDNDFRPNNVNIGVRGHFLRLSLDALTGVAGANWEYTITPSQAFVLDRKMDDGAPYTGQVFSSGADCVNGDALNAAYDRIEEDESCAMYFKFGGRRG